MSKNSRMLASFREFCRKHPELRFWQALSVWADKRYIYTTNTLIESAFDSKGEKITDLRDTFYKE